MKLIHIFDIYDNITATQLFAPEVNLVRILQVIFKQNLTFKNYLQVDSMNQPYDNNTNVLNCSNQSLTNIPTFLERQYQIENGGPLVMRYVYVK